MTKTEFATLPYRKKLDAVTKLYMAKCDNLPGKYAAKMFKARGFFAKEEPEILSVVFNYLDDIEKTPLNPWVAIQRAKTYDAERRVAATKEKITDVQKYDEFDLGMLGL